MSVPGAVFEVVPWGSRYGVPNYAAKLHTTGDTHQPQLVIAVSESPDDLNQAALAYAEVVRQAALRLFPPGDDHPGTAQAAQVTTDIVTRHGQYVVRLEVPGHPEPIYLGRPQASQELAYDAAVDVLADIGVALNKLHQRKDFGNPFADGDRARIAAMEKEGRAYHD